MKNVADSLALVCLLPVRNSADLLPQYFDNVRRFCMGIFALDDGSTDDTAAVLAAEPLVKRILRNASRPTSKGWDDAANRQRLLDECDALRPKWVLWLDADELIPTFDIPHLVNFLLTEATVEQAYGFEVLRMVRDLKHFDKNKLWTYRLFSYRCGYRLPEVKLHFEPVPIEIPQSSWRRTRLRIAHLAGLTSSSRRARYQKYLAADPNCEWQASYAELLDPPGHAWELKPFTSTGSLFLR